MSFHIFKKYALKLFLKSNYSFQLKKNTLTNIYYPWKSNTKIFSWFTIFDNYKTNNDKIYFRDEATKYCYDFKNKSYYWHKHIIWIAPIFIKYLQQSDFLYIDATYISTKEYYQLLIVMAYNVIIDKKIPCAYILMNNKLQNSYEIIFNCLLEYITTNYTIELKCKSICTDFEDALYNAIKKIFKNVRHVGCLFHFAKNIRLNLSKLGLFSEELSEITNDLFKNICIFPFIYDSNNKINL